MKILVTGAAGFIGSHTAQRLLARGYQVVGLDNLNEYYDVTLKQTRLARLTTHSQFRFVKLDLADEAAIAGLLRAREVCARGCTWQAQAGGALFARRPACLRARNVTGTLNVLEGCRQPRRRAPGVRLDQLGVRRQHQHAVLGAQQRRSPAVAVRGQQARQRTDGAQLLGAVQTAEHRLAF